MLMTVILVAGTLIWPEPFSDDNVDSYLRNREITIGIRDNLPGWMVRSLGSEGQSTDQLSGFDGKLVSFLEREYNFHPKILTLHQNERETALITSQVDLVIDNFSMTKDRMGK